MKDLYQTLPRDGLTDFPNKISNYTYLTEKEMRKTLHERCREIASEAVVAGVTGQGLVSDSIELLVRNERRRFAEKVAEKFIGTQFSKLLKEAINDVESDNES